MCSDIDIVSGSLILNRLVRGCSSHDLLLLLLLLLISEARIVLRLILLHGRLGILGFLGAKARTEEAGESLAGGALLGCVFRLCCGGSIAFDVFFDFIVPSGDFKLQIY